jgi:hypothetical protein
MAALRSRRLERLLAARLDAVTHGQVTDLVANAVTEAYDLDFKGELYGNGDSDKRALASDVAAMANTAGGVIVLGIAEDNQARAAAALGVALSDGEVGRLRQIVASLVSPLPTFDPVPVGSAEGGARVPAHRRPAQPFGAARRTGQQRLAGPADAAFAA